MATNPGHEDELGVNLAIQEARISLKEGGIPIGAALIHFDGTSSKILGCGHNQRIQKSSATLHGEISALEAAGRISAALYRKSTMYTTLSPCSMCTGAILLYRIPRVVIGENVNFMGGEDLLKQNGVEVVVLDNQDCKDMMSKFIQERPEDWYEDIGEERV